jgi:hypothetical protein
VTVPEIHEHVSSFVGFVDDCEPRLRRALVSRYGLEDGREATAHALAWAWEHWLEVQEMTNPVGYLYRVGCSRFRARRRPVFEQRLDSIPDVEPGLGPALDQLSERQRVGHQPIAAM